MVRSLSCPQRPLNQPKTPQVRFNEGTLESCRPDQIQIEPGPMIATFRCGMFRLSKDPTVAPAGPPPMIATSHFIETLFELSDKGYPLFEFREGLSRRTYYGSYFFSHAIASLKTSRCWSQRLGKWPEPG